MPAQAQKKKPGRPSSYTKEKADIICSRLINGESLRKICREEGMPDQETIFRWIDSFEEFRGQYARARDLQAETIFDEILEIADNKADDPQRSRVQIDARKWMAGKLYPKRYGDKAQVEHSGAISLETLVLESMMPDPS